ncbi:MAG: hypothetical protein GY784_08080 [Gammaproteobacteria bacterium]|nr:hypothetical protein [Gammaproteobacteria bacterium]
MRILLFVMFSLLSANLFAEIKLETIELEHRLASDVLPTVQAFLPSNSTARAHKNLIIIKADNVVINEVRELIKQLDTPLQRINITLVNTDQNLAGRQKTNIDFGIAVNDGGDVSVNAGVNHWSTKESRNRDQQYRAQGLTDNPITISMRQDTPQQDQLIFVGPFGHGVETNTTYISLDNGFQAVARLLAEQQVQVDIHPFFSALSRSSGSISQSQAITSLVGPLGQWIELGYIGKQENIDSIGTRTYSSHQTQVQRLYLKVELIPYSN